MGQCTAASKRGKGGRCGRQAIRGGTVCWNHGGANRDVKAKADIRATAMELGLGGLDVEPAEIVLRLLSQSQARAEALALELERLVEKHGSLHDAIVGESLAADGEGRMHKVGEYIRGLPEAEYRERKFAADLAFRAQAAEIAYRHVELKERERALMLEVLRAVLLDARLGLSAAQRALVPSLIREHLGIQPASDPVIVGSVPPVPGRN